MIPRRLIRIWLGTKPLGAMFEQWWSEFRALHPAWELLTIDDKMAETLLRRLHGIHGIAETYFSCSRYTERADVMRAVALHLLGGVYVDIDVKPLRPFDPLIEDPRAFAGARSSCSIECAVLGFPMQHLAMRELLLALPAHFFASQGGSPTKTTGPGFFNSIIWGRPDVRVLPRETFYPFAGWGGPPNAERQALLSRPNVAELYPQSYAAHYASQQWRKIEKAK